VNGKKTPGTIHFALAPNKKCLLTRYQGERLPATQRIDGYDAATREWIMMGFDADGGRYNATLDIADMKKGKRFGKGLIGRWEYTQSNADGTTASGSATFSCTEWGKGRYVVIWSDRKENGQSPPDLKWVQERPK